MQGGGSGREGLSLGRVVGGRRGGQRQLFDDVASLGEMSLNSAVSGLSYASYRSHGTMRSYHHLSSPTARRRRADCTRGVGAARRGPAKVLCCDVI